MHVVAILSARLCHAQIGAATETKHGATTRCAMDCKACNPWRPAVRNARPVGRAVTHRFGISQASGAIWFHFACEGLMWKMAPMVGRKTKAKMAPMVGRKTKAKMAHISKEKMPKAKMQKAKMAKLAQAKRARAAKAKMEKAKMAKMPKAKTATKAKAKISKAKTAKMAKMAKMEAKEKAGFSSA